MYNIHNNIQYFPIKKLPDINLMNLLKKEKKKKIKIKSFLSKSKIKLNK